MLGRRGRDPKMRLLVCLFDGRACIGRGWWCSSLRVHVDWIGCISESQGAIDESNEREPVYSNAYFRITFLDHYRLAQSGLIEELERRIG